MPLLTLFYHLETFRACIHPMVTTSMFMGYWRNTPWLSHTLTLMGQTHQTVKKPSAWTAFGLILAGCYFINLFIVFHPALDATLGAAILACALAENTYIAITSPRQNERTTANITCAFLFLVVIMAQTAITAPLISYSLAACLFTLLALKNLYSLACYLRDYLFNDPKPLLVPKDPKQPNNASTIKPERSSPRQSSQQTTFLHLKKGLRQRSSRKHLPKAP